ncbi:hypothetical protein CCY99_04195 [Helicobacter sp. 16-1353]|uniref:hypothetical protein n=1 Tax=Helicobacter sp. 16-1353 TaxID=2004996 RepID=UPI000DCB2B1B|nr:hypothetical protein [Helicobacter sp. 16-1353]RAX54219.1 hypothetical protein CCY99_04195 [Helicobacter sp. 16-1353]
MNSVINILLFFIFIIMLATLFIAVNMYIGKLSMEDIKTSFIGSDFIHIKNKPKDDNKSTWISSLASKNIADFSYPISELAIILDFSNAKKTNILTIENLDSYKFFCLNEILKNNDIKFAYTKVADFVTLDVALNKEGLKETLINELKKYNISYHIK